MASALLIQITVFVKADILLKAGRRQTVRFWIGFLPSEVSGAELLISSRSSCVQGFSLSLLSCDQ